MKLAAQTKSRPNARGNGRRHGRRRSSRRRATRNSQHSYRVVRGKICKHTDGSDVPLCNFKATIDEEIVLDNGVERTRNFVISGVLEDGTRLSKTRVAAAQFNGMKWVQESWGARAIITAGPARRDQLREAIQQLSPQTKKRQVFTHTGWREIGGNWIYLSSNGAVNNQGYEVDLGPDLKWYALPQKAVNPKAAMRLSLDLLKLAPIEVIAPMWGTVFRAPLASALPLDLALWVEGVTGSLKSTIASLFLSHYGDFERTKLPGSWTSTANQLERRAFTLKDTVFVVDDYAPSGVDAKQFEGKASRLLRAQGNLSGRGRLNADLTERRTYPPRGFLVGTGEQRPTGQSVLARTLVVELDRDQVKLKELSRLQSRASLLKHAMAGYIEWLQPQMPTMALELRRRFTKYRALASKNAPHLRIPEAVAHIYIGIYLAATYAKSIGACTAADARRHRKEAWKALQACASTQGHLVRQEEPTRRFLEILSNLISQKKVTFDKRR